MLKAIIDTHAIIWYVMGDSRLSGTAHRFVQATFANGDDIGLATISLVEMIYLIEKQRIDPFALQEIRRLAHDPVVGLLLIALDEDIAQALATIPRDQVPDMPDRIISATAVRHGLPVISRDGKIQISTVPTIW